MLRKAWVFAIAAGALLGIAVTVPADSPGLKVVVAVTGLDKKEQQTALENALKSDERFSAVKAEPNKVTLDVKPGASLQLSVIETAAKSVSTDAVPVAVDKAGTKLGQHCALKILGSDGSAEAATIKALQGVDGVAKVEGKDGAFEMDFKSSKSVALTDINASLQKSLPAIDGAVPVSISDVVWTAPEAPAPKKKEHPHKKKGG